MTKLLIWQVQCAWTEAYWDALVRRRHTFTRIRYGTRRTLYRTDPVTHAEHRVGGKA